MLKNCFPSITKNKNADRKIYKYIECDLYSIYLWIIELSISRSVLLTEG